MRDNFVTYKNGNYIVKLNLDNGTKIRFTKADEFIAEKPESMDLKITNLCDMGCAFCHENSNATGKHGDILNLKFLETLLPYTELAIGGGNPLSHPDLIPFLEKCRELKLVPSMTVHQFHFMKSQALIKKLVDEKLIYGLGVSLISANDSFIDEIKKYPNAVIHIINGVQSLTDIKKLYDHNLKILILGYKEFRRGKEYYSDFVEDRKSEFYNELPEMIKHFNVVSFDNLGLKQLDCKRIVDQKTWDTAFMGNDGDHTMYIDAVNNQFARCSIALDRYDLLDDIKDMFDIIKKELENDK